MFPVGVLDDIASRHYLWIRAGADDHRFVPIWSVVDGGRLFIRSWNVRRGGWHEAFAKEKRGAIKAARDGHAFPVLARRVRSERLRDLVDSGFKAKYTTPASLKYVRGFRTKERRAATFELIFAG